MSYIKKRGEQAAESALEEKVDYSKALGKFKSGTTYKVRFASAIDFIEYESVSVFGKINTTPIVDGNLYEKAVKLLYADAKAEKDSKKAEETRELAYQLSPKSRFLFAFYDLETGNPVVIDVSKPQSKIIIQGLQKYAKKIDKLAFELAKSGTGTATTVTLSPVLDIDEDLSANEKKHFEATKGKTIDDEIFEVLYVRNLDEQIEDLRKIGFDTSRVVATQATPSVDIGESDDMFDDEYNF